MTEYVSKNTNIFIHAFTKNQKHNNALTQKTELLHQSD